MKIVGQSPNELVVRDSSLWLSAIFIAAALLLLYFFVVQGDRRALVAMAVTLALALVWARRSTFTFNAATQRIDYTRLRWLRTASGTIRFSDVQAIDIQAMSGDNGTTIYRRKLTVD